MINQNDITIEKVHILQPIIENEDIKNTHNELISLIYSANAEYVSTTYQNIKEINPATFFGSGKLLEIKEQIREEKISTVVFNGELSPSQTLNISKVFDDIKVIDRTTLILDIFAQRAKTAEGKLQVELAQLKYIYPRLKGKGIALSKLGGGIGSRGPGETQLETDRRHIKLRINILNNELEKLKTRRNLQTEHRKKSQVFAISLIGYTNTGKSTLLNLLTDSDIYVKDQLFATLDPTTRKFKLNNFEALLTDTVGFISNLPHNLVEAFKSTLESAVNSDLNLIICDAERDYKLQIDTTLNTLNELKCTTPYFIVINKSEKLESRENYPSKAIFVSAKENLGIDNLLKQINDFFENKFKNLKLKFDYKKLVTYLKLQKYFTENSIKYEEDCIKADITISKINLSKIKDLI